ncbi:MAG: HAD-IIIA family hydrolase [Pedosphaera sp.]|nr:HAD-IIIA family hydrolase [Pedosphaera sp.]
MKQRTPERAAVFLDRDGVLIEDVHLLTRADQLRILPGVPRALERLHEAGFQLVVVSNQPVVARGLVSEADVKAVHEELERRLIEAGSPPIRRFYFCPHHPNATLLSYRKTCECRKPRPGLFLQAIEELGLSAADSYTVGDRITDIIAGATVGSRTILVETGVDSLTPIETSEPLDASVRPDYTCADLPAAATWILESR